MELPRPVQVAVIGDGEGVHAQRVDPVEQLRNPVGAVEEGVLAVCVEVDERHTASGRYRRSRALSKPRRVGYFRPMRGLASLFALGLMMALFHRVTAGAALEARATLALGFLLLAAFVGGDLARRARLPRITAYVLVGFAVGPWLGLVRRDEVDALRFLGDVALGVIALAAGSELALSSLRGQLLALVRLVGGAIVVPLLVVAAVLLSVSPWFPLTLHQSARDAVTVALALGGLAAVSSPAVAVGMLSGLGAGGPFGCRLLGV